MAGHSWRSARNATLACPTTWLANSIPLDTVFCHDRSLMHCSGADAPATAMRQLGKKIRAHTRFPVRANFTRWSSAIRFKTDRLLRQGRFLKTRTSKGTSPCRIFHRRTAAARCRDSDSLTHGKPLGMTSSFVIPKRPLSRPRRWRHNQPRSKCRKVQRRRLSGPDRGAGTAGRIWH